MNPIYRTRRRNDIIVRLLCVGAALFGVTWLAFILFTLFYNGLAGISVQLFTENTPPPGAPEGGLLHAIVGSGIMNGISVRRGAQLALFAWGGVGGARPAAGGGAACVVCVSCPGGAPPPRTCCCWCPIRCARRL